MFLVRIQLTSIDEPKKTFNQFFTISREIDNEKIIELFYPDSDKRFTINIVSIDKVYGNDVHYLNRYGVIEDSKIC